MSKRVLNNKSSGPLKKAKKSNDKKEEPGYYGSRVNFFNYFHQDKSAEWLKKNKPQMTEYEKSMIRQKEIRSRITPVIDDKKNEIEKKKNDMTLLNKKIIVTTPEIITPLITISSINIISDNAISNDISSMTTLSKSDEKDKKYNMDNEKNILKNTIISNYSKAKVILAIIGSQTFNDYPLFCKEIDRLRKNIDIKYIVSGGDIGADTLANRYAKDQGLRILIIYPNWKNHQKNAGFLRNQEIIDEADHIIAFWDGMSYGTKNSIDIAHRMNKPIHVINTIELHDMNMKNRKMIELLESIGYLEISLEKDDKDYKKLKKVLGIYLEYCIGSIYCNENYLTIDIMIDNRLYRRCIKENEIEEKYNTIKKRKEVLNIAINDINKCIRK